jgi:hypothetical protein
MIAKRKCSGTSKKGTPCRAIPLKPGTVLKGVTVTGNWCSTHDPDLPESARIQGAQPGAGRPRKPRVVDLMREWVEDHPEAFGVIQEALQADRAVVVGNTKDAYVEYVPDWPTRIVAFKELMDRAYGKPTQSVQIVSRDDFMERVADMEAEFAALDKQLEAESPSQS